MKLDYGRPDRPTDNPFSEAFNGRLRVECLDQSWFASLDEANTGLERFRNEHNTERPHTALDMKTPAEYVAEWLANPPPGQ